MVFASETPQNKNWKKKFATYVTMNNIRAYIINNINKSKELFQINKRGTQSIFNGFLKHFDFTMATDINTI